MLISTQDVIVDKKIVKTLGLVRGNSVRSRNAVRNTIAGLKTIFGGEISEFTKAVAETREQALDRMIAEAKDLGANAILAVRFVGTEVDQQSSEILAYGTAVVIE